MMDWPWWAGLLLALPWVVGALVAVLAPRFKPDLADVTPLPPERSPLLSVVLPARNEAANIERCLRSLMASRYPNLEIVVVDDRSDDGTAEIATRLAGGDQRVLVVRGEDLPAGWYGKPWACWQGFQHTRGSLLLFTDADTWHGPELHGRAVAALQAAEADLLTGMPHQAMETFWERAVQPFFFLFLGIRFQTPERINRSTEPRDAVANGQFILVTRDSYERIGGHRAVHDTVIEDLMIAMAYRRAGLKHHFVMMRDLTVRMYTTLREIIDGWTKNFFAGALYSVGRADLAYIAVTFSLFIPLAFVVPAAAFIGGTVTATPAVAAFGGAAFTACSIIMGRILRDARVHPLWGAAHPLGALVQMVIVVRGALRGMRRIEWKGRTYSHP
jgi:chlorobactene glucosyltransferase